MSEEEIAEKSLDVSSSETVFLASYSDIISAFSSPRVRWIQAAGFLCTIFTGLVIPGLVFFATRSFEQLSASAVGDDTFLESLKNQSLSLVALGAIAFVANSIQSILFNITSSEMELVLKKKWFEALLRQDIGFHETQDVASTGAIISTQAATFRHGVGQRLAFGLQYSFTLLFSLIFAFISSWRTSLLILATIPVVTATMIYMFHIITNENSVISQSYSEAGSIVYSSITSLRTILSLNLVQRYIALYQTATEKARQAASQYKYKTGFAVGLAIASFILMYMVSALFGSFLLYDNIEATGCDPSGGVRANETCDPNGSDILGALLAIVLASWGLPQITDAIEGLGAARASCSPAIQVIQRAENTHNHDPPTMTIDSASSSGLRLPKVSGEIEFKNVTFAYPSRPEQKIFNNFSIKIAPGSKVAFVGQSGTGKSTVIQLIERFYDPDEGSITLDGHDLKTLNVNWLRNTVGLVGQEPILFTASIRDNICADMSNATQDDIEAVAKQSNAHDFIKSFPDGYDTYVGDSGALSGGQKQRVAIARTLLRKPKILLLDEATSALDSQSETVVQNAIDKVVSEGDRTTITIAHRLSTIQNADIIYVIKDGGCVEHGDHEYLLTLKGNYYNLINAQTHSSPSRVVSEVEEPKQVLEPGQNCGKDIVEFNDVGFTYPARETQSIFNGLSLTIREGETLALVGPSGHGKSTIIQLIERFYDATEGSILYNGTDIKELNVEQYRSQISLVGQEPTLFNTSIFENILFGRPGATRTEVEEAAKQANAHDFITGFPDGYDTPVGNAGASRLSGGQKQRIAIARALINNPKILLLDEATSALDSESEQIVQQALDGIMSSPDRTVVVIAHRFSSIQGADRIAVISGGEVAELGAHSDLMAISNGIYKNLVELQSAGHEASPERSTNSAPKGAQRLGSMSRQFEVVRKAKRPSLATLSMPFVVGDGAENDTAACLTDEEDMVELESNSDGQNLFAETRRLLEDSTHLFAMGILGAFLTGVVFPAWGLILAFVIELLYTPVLPCTDELLSVITELSIFSTCDEYTTSVVEDMRMQSFRIAGGCVCNMICAIIGNTLLSYGFGNAAEVVTKKLRDQAYQSLLRQEPGYFDVRNAGAIASRLERDVSKVNALVSDPLRGVMAAISSLVIGLAIAFVYMWPTALLAVGVLPFQVFAAAIESSRLSGGTRAKSDDGQKTDSGGIAIEALSNIKTVASLTLESQRLCKFSEILDEDKSANSVSIIVSGLASGLSELIKLWIYALIFWFGGWVIFTWPSKFDFLDFLVAVFVFIFSASGLAANLGNLADRPVTILAARRVFALINRESKIDPLSVKGISP